MSGKDWSKTGWRQFPAKQQPLWPNASEYEAILGQISLLPALVFAGETRSLIDQLAEASRGEAFVLQAGDCAEDFSSCHGPTIHDLLKVILQMSIILTHAGQRKVVKIGRIAGQYAKPRSSDTEVVGNSILPSYRGDMVNAAEPTIEDRTPDPKRVLSGYFRATANLNLVRAFTQGGYASLDLAHAWSEVSSRGFAENPEYSELVAEIRRSIKFMEAIGIDPQSPQLKTVSLYTSHEALLLGYEEALTRIDTTTGDWYDTSAHMLWIGDRTRQLQGAHVEFLRGVGNPIGVKIGPQHDIAEIEQIVQRLNPSNRPGRIVLITRFGADAVPRLLPPLVREVTDRRLDVAWLCDPMHGNTYVTSSGHKTRKYDDILREIDCFFSTHEAQGTIPAGLHLELTGQPVTECAGGRQGIREDQLEHDYRSTCDPRLNAAQAIQLAFEVASKLSSKTIK